MRKFWKNHKGVTMVEVLVTVAILAIVVAPCLSAFVMAQRGNVKAAEAQAAYTAAANLMEELKGLPIGSIPDRLDNDKSKEINAGDGVHVIYEPVEKPDDTIAYYTVWIYNGEGDNTVKVEETVPDGYILKGVIAP